MKTTLAFVQNLKPVLDEIKNKITENPAKKAIYKSDLDAGREFNVFDDDVFVSIKPVKKGAYDNGAWLDVMSTVSNMPEANIVFKVEPWWLASIRRALNGYETPSADTESLIAGLNL